MPSNNLMGRIGRSVSVMMLTVLVACPGLVRAGNGLPEETQARILAMTALSDMLLYYNPKFENGDPQIQQRYQQALMELNHWASVRLPGSPILLGIADMANQVQTLEQQPADQAYLLPMWMNKVVQSHAHLEQLLAERKKGEPTVHESLSLALAMQNLAYQTSTNSSVSLMILGGRADIMTYLDEQVTAGFITLQDRFGKSDAFKRLTARYDMIRERLLGVHAEWVPNLVSFHHNSMQKLVSSISRS